MNRLLQQIIQALLWAEARVDSPRRALRNGYRHRTLGTRVGRLDVLLPRFRRGAPPVELFRRFSPNEGEIMNTLGRIYLRGFASPLEIQSMAERLCGHPFSPNVAAEIASHLTSELARHMRRQLESEYPCCAEWHRSEC